jgi:metal-dependent amidase/aminoacylase/carboxypeptidase family protein
MLAAVDIFEIALRGKGGHAAMPPCTRDVIPAAAQLVLALQTIVSRETDPMAAAVLSVTNLNAGSGAFNVIRRSSATLTGTVRTFATTVRDQHRGSHVASHRRHRRRPQHHRRVHLQAPHRPTINDPESTLHCQAAAAAIAGEANVLSMEPIMGGEDFGGFLEVRPGAFMAIGQGEDSRQPAQLHLPLAPLRLQRRHHPHRRRVLRRARRTPPPHRLMPRASGGEKVIAFISSLPFFVGIKGSIEKLVFGCLVYSALRHKENVAAKYDHGVFEIVATGTPPKNLR